MLLAVTVVPSSSRRGGGDDTKIHLVYLHAISSFPSTI